MYSDSDSDFDMDPALAARAALLVARFAAAIQATKELQALRNRPQLLALEKLALKCLDKGDAAFLKQKRLFRMMPPPLLERFCRECSSKWRHPPLAGVVMNPHTRHLCLNLDVYLYTFCEVESWTLENLYLLCDDVAREGKTSLLSLEIHSQNEPTGSHPGLLVTQVSSLLLELRALTSLHIVALWCSQPAREIDLLVSILASNNPDIRSLRLPHLSNKSLCTIADRWPQLEELKPDKYEFDSSELEAVLPRLRNLETLDISGGILSPVIMSVARAHDPASPPYKLADGFACWSSNPPVSSGDMVQLFTAFPALYWLKLLETDIPAVCAGLEGREHVHITDVYVTPTSSNPRALEPLLTRVGEHLTKFEVPSDSGILESRVDLNMIGHYCPKLENLEVYAGEFISGEGFEVTETYYSKLKWCFLYHDGPADLPTELVCRVLASPTLESCDTTGVPITEEVVAALVEKREQGALSSLELLVVFHTSIDVAVLAELASHAPRLRQLILNTYDDEDEGLLDMKDVLTSFMQQAGLKATVSVEL